MSRLSKEETIDLYKRGATVGQIAALAGLSSAAISLRLSKAGVEKRKRFPKKEEIKKEVKDDIPMTDAAKFMKPLYAVGNLGLAAALIVQGEKMSTLEVNVSGRATFLFIDTPMIESLKTDFYNHHLSTDALSLFEAIGMLKGLVWEKKEKKTYA